MEIHPECEVIAEGEDEEDRLESLYKNCSKNPGHAGFIPVHKFKMEDLPEERRTTKMMEYLKARFELTVRIVVNFTSFYRPPKFSDINAPYPYSNLRGSSTRKRFGTGTVIHVTPLNDAIKDEMCPCHVCSKLKSKLKQEDGEVAQELQEQPASQYWKAIVRTATHVVFDDFEVKSSVFDCFYDSDTQLNDGSVKKLYGKRILPYTGKKSMNTYLSDMCHIECVTHDKDLVQRLNESLPAIQEEFANPDFSIPLGIVISHPHGCSKRISLGKVYNLTYPLMLEFGYPEMPEVTKCRLPLYPWSKYPQQGNEGDNNFPDYHNINNDNNKHLDNNDKSETETESKTETSQDFSPFPGTKFSLPHDLAIDFPDDAPFAAQYTYHDPNWFVLPPGTTFKLANGTDVFFPPETEFFDNGWVSGCCYVNYDSDTCPGSSGASLIHDLGRHQFRINFPHMGSSSRTNNRSGLHFYDLMKRL